MHVLLMLFLLVGYVETMRCFDSDVSMGERRTRYKSLERSNDVGFHEVARSYLSATSFQLTMFHMALR